VAVNDDEALIDDLLERTSRTFALAIPLLPMPTRRAVGLGYLLFRVADTFEDAFAWDASSRVRALHGFVALFGADGRLDERGARDHAKSWLEGPAGPPTEHEGYRALLRALPEVFAAVNALPREVALILTAHVERTARGMARIIEHAQNGLVRLESLSALRDYCYVVAGIVGELLTALFVHDHPTPFDASTTEVLRSTERAFGEGLQLVNILKDENGDALEGRTFLPSSVARGDVIALARRDLVDAERYVAALRQARVHPGVVAFTALPLELAAANLDLLERNGAGAKLERSFVASVLARYSLDD
jgi:farnesyl-diphosphate farnesyltransferase